MSKEYLHLHQAIKAFTMRRSGANYLKELIDWKGNEDK